MPIFTTDYLNEIVARAEIELSQEVPVIFHRFSLHVVPGVNLYVLPKGVIRILRVTYKGKKVYASSHRMSQSWLKQQNPARGTPVIYLRDGIGTNKIMFYPAPLEEVLADDTDLNTVDGIQRRVIITCFMASTAPFPQFRLPQYIRRNIIKYRAMQRAYHREGPNQNIEASLYFEQKYKYYLQLYKDIMGRIPKAVLLEFGDRTNRVAKPARPTLPTGGKWSI